MTAIPNRDAYPQRKSYAALHSTAYRAYRVLQVIFVVAPLIAGVDKFFNKLTNWDMYLSPMVTQQVGDPHRFMMIVGGIEIVAALGVALKPKYFGYVVAAWLAGIISNLLMTRNFYDIALRDFGLMLAALTLADLARMFDFGMVGGLFRRHPRGTLLESP